MMIINTKKNPQWQYSISIGNINIYIYCLYKKEYCKIQLFCELFIIVFFFFFNFFSRVILIFISFLFNTEITFKRKQVKRTEQN